MTEARWVFMMLSVIGWNRILLSENPAVAWPLRLLACISVSLLFLFAECSLAQINPDDPA